MRGVWTADISFTGIAQVGGTKTRNWISQTIIGLPGESDAATVMENLALVGTQVLRPLSPDIRKLTIFAAVTQQGNPLRLFLVSNVSRPDGPPLANTLDHLKSYEISADKPKSFIFGYTEAVTPQDKKLLKDLSCRSGDPGEIRKLLSEINRRSAKRSKGYVSEDCGVSSLFLDGTHFHQQFGSTDGIPHDILGSEDFGKRIEPLLEHYGGDRRRYVQGNGAQAANAKSLSLPPMNTTAGNTLVVGVKTDSDRPSDSFVTDAAGSTFTEMPRPGVPDIEPDIEPESPIGEPKTITFSSPTSSGWITTPTGNKLASVVIGGMNGSLQIRKNFRQRALLNDVTVTVEGGISYQGPPITGILELNTVPIIDGIRPVRWAYTIDVSIEGTYTFTIRRNSVAFRSGNYKAPMSVVTNTEELLMRAPTRRLTLRASPQSPTAHADIQAEFLLQDVPVQRPTTEKKQIASGRVGRNDPCPCNSGKKYKKCCGRAA